MIEDVIIRINPESEGFGRLFNFQVDNSEKFLICAFTKNKVAVYSIETGNVLMSIEDSGMNCEDCFIDESCCYMATLDDKRRFANIYTFEWTYKVEQPTVPKPKK